MIDRPRTAWEWDRFAALVVAMLDEHVGPTASMREALGVGGAWWNCFRRGWYRSAITTYDAIRPVTAAYQSGVLARHMFEEAGRG